MERVARGPVANVLRLRSARVSSLHAPSAPMFCLVALAVLFGGGGSPAPVAEIVVVVGAITFAAVAVIFSPDRDLRIGPAHWAIALLLPALAVLQLLPLPLAFRPNLPLGSQLAAVLQAGGSGWPDAMRLAVMAFPWGTGLDTFEQAFPLVECLTAVDATHANRAHSDWLEFLSEAGVFALVATGWIANRIVKHMTTLEKSRLTRGDLFAFAVLAIVGLHALVDYPFRSLSLAVVSATALVLMLSAERGVANEE